MKKGLFTVLTTCATVFALASCGEPEMKEMKISNKDDLIAVWHVGDAARTLTFTSDPAIDAQKELDAGNLSLKIGDASVITADKLTLTPAKVGTTTVELIYKQKTYDSVEITVSEIPFNMSITNKAALQAEWHVGEAARTVTFESTTEVDPSTVALAIQGAGVFSVSGLKLTPVKAGTATVSLRYQNKNYDSVELTVLEEVPSMEMSITNKAELTKEWHFGDTSRTITLATNPAINIKQELANGNLVATSSNTDAVAMAGLEMSTVGEGEATISVSYKGKTYDSFEVEVLPKVGLVIVTEPVEGEEYILSMESSTGTRFAVGDKDGYYIKTEGAYDKSSPVKVEIDTEAKDAYRYKILVQDSKDATKWRTIGGYHKDGHYNIGFLDEYSDSTPYALQLFKLNDDFSYSTVVDDTEMWLGTYSTYTTVSFRQNNVVEYKARLYQIGEVPAITSLTLNKTTLEIEHPNAEQLNATIAPVEAFQKVTWTSSDEGVAKVSINGLVSSVGKGECDITASAGGKTAKCHVTVTEAAPINYGSLEHPLTVEEASTLVSQFKGNVTPEPIFVAGVVSENGAWSASYKNYGDHIYLKNGDNAKAFDCYRVTRDSTISDDFNNADSLKDCEVVVTGYAKLYNGTPEILNTAGSGEPNNAVLKKVTPPVVPLEGIQIDGPENCEEKLSVTLTARPIPNLAPLGEVTWSITEGGDYVSLPETKTGKTIEVTAVKPGVATIHAECGGFSDDFELTVIASVNYGSLEHPLSVDEAVEALDHLPDNGYTPVKMFVEGTVSSSSFSTKYSNFTLWYQSNDGLTEQSFEAYGVTMDPTIKEDYTAANALVGKIVLSEGWGQKYVNSSTGAVTYEITNKNPSGETENGVIRKVSTPALTDIEITGLEEIAVGDEVTYTANPIPGGAVLGEVTWSVVEGGEFVTLPETKTGSSIVVTGTAVGTATIKAECGDFDDTFEISVAGEAEKVYKETLFGEKYNSGAISAYDQTWTATNNGFTIQIVNASNNSNNDTGIRAGRKSVASVATLTTVSAIDKIVTKVEVNFTQFTKTDKVKAAVLQISADGITWTDIGSFAKEKKLDVIEIPSDKQAANLYYRLSFDCDATGDNGNIRLDKIDFYAVF